MRNDRNIRLTSSIIKYTGFSLAPINTHPMHGKEWPSGQIRDRHQALRHKGKIARSRAGVKW